MNRFESTGLSGSPWGVAVGRGPIFPLLHHAGSKKPLDPCVGWEAADTGHEGALRHVVKRFFDVRVQCVVTLTGTIHGVVDPLNRVVRASARAKAVAGRFQFRLPVGFQGCLDDCLFTSA